MEPKLQVVITPFGAFRERTNYEPIDINQGVLNQLTNSITRKHPGVVPGSVLKNGPSRPIGLCIGGGSNAWSVEIDELQINTTFATSSNGELVYPAFNDKNLPIMNLPWKVPFNMRLMFMLITGKSNELMAQYFVAFDNGGRIYILPMGNIFEDGKLCYGPYADSRKTSLDALHSAWNQFNVSKWQQDLYNANSSMTNTQSLFSFKVEKDKFTQMFPTDGSKDWTKFATKIANDFITQNVVLNNTKQ